MNIAMFTNVYLPLVGGVEISTAAFSADLRAAGHRALVVTPRTVNAGESTDEVLRVPAIRGVAGSDFSLRVPLPGYLTERLDSFAPDLIHSHQPFMLGDTALREARARRIPLVFTNHTLWERYADVFGFETEAGKRLARSLPVEYANLCDLVIAPTASVAKLLKQRGVTRRITVAPTGIDTAFYAGGDRQGERRRRGLPAAAIVAGHVGRLLRAKNVAYLARAMSRALAAEPRLHFLLVGDGAALPAMRQTFAAAGVADRVSVTGALHGQAVADAYAAMDFFTFTSHTDTQGLVLAEAFAAGNPVLALDAPGARDVIRADRDGVLLPAEADEAAFAAAVLALARDPARRAELGANARERADAYARETCARRLLAAYQSLLADWQPRAADDALWEELLDRIGVEWQLIKAKASMAASMFGNDPETATEEVGE